MDRVLQFELALMKIPGVGAVTLRQLVAYSGSAEAVFYATRERLLRIPGVGLKTVSLIDEFKENAKAFADAEWQRIQEDGVSLYSYRDQAYPWRFKNLPNAPIVLYKKGKADWNQSRSISIVGTRRSSSYGKAIVEEIVKALVPYKPLIVSGLAYGIDYHAHKAALDYDLPTIAVMATGIDKVYPANHMHLAQQIVQKGALVTERPFGSSPDARRFPERNRIIAGLSDLTLVVEAGKSGGAIITAHIANEYGREVMAVPGSLHQKSSEGCNELIRNHKAHIFTRVEDLIELLNWDEQLNSKQLSLNLQPALTDEQNQVLKAFQEDRELGLDVIAYRAKLNIAQTTAILLELEFLGSVQPSPGKRYRIIT